MYQRQSLAEVIMNTLREAAADPNGQDKVPEYEDILAQNIFEFSQVPEIRIKVKNVVNILNQFNGDGCTQEECFSIFKNIIRKTVAEYPSESIQLLNAIHCANVPFSYQQVINLLEMFRSSELCMKLRENNHHNFEFYNQLQEKNLQIELLRNECADKDRLISLYRLPPIYVQPAKLDTDIFNAVTSGNLQSVQFLTERCRDYVEAVENNGNTPFLLACSHGHISIVQYLVTQQFANLSASNKYRRNCLHMSAANGYLQIIDYLLPILPNDISVDSLDIEFNTPLHRAAYFAKDINMIKRLLRLGANKYHRNKSNKTPFDVCGQSRNAVPAVVKEAKKLLDCRNNVA